MRIEITMATMGRLMKNFDMAGYLFPSVGAASFFSGASGVNGFGVHRGAGTDFLGPLGHHGFARLQSFTDDPVGTDPRTHLYLTNLNLVIASHHRHHVFPLDVAHRPLGNQDRPFLHRHEGLDDGETAGAKHIPGIGEERAHLEGAGGGIDLPVGQGKLALVRVDTAVGQNQLQGDVLHVLTAVPHR